MFRQYRLQDFRLRLVVLVYAITILGILVIGSAAEEYAIGHGISVVAAERGK